MRTRTTRDHVYRQAGLPARLEGTRRHFERWSRRMSARASMAWPGSATRRSSRIRCERALKKAILHRKNALFYKTCHGAHVGDTFMSLIHTGQFCGADPFDTLTALQRHAAERPANPPK